MLIFIVADFKASIKNNSNQQQKEKKK